MAGGTNKLTAVQIKNTSAWKVQDGNGLTLIRKAACGKWLFGYSFSGRSREMGLGSFPEVPSAEARKQRAHWQQILQAGKDPISERDRVCADELARIKKDDPTFEDMTMIVYETIRGSMRGDGARGLWLLPIKTNV